MSDNPPKVPDVVIVLEGARALIADPQNWTRGCLAANENGWPCGPEEPGATRFCAIGATWASAERAERAGLDPKRAAVARVRAELALYAVAPLVPGLTSVQSYNDRPQTTHADILQLFDRALERVRR